MGASSKAIKSAGAIFVVAVLASAVILAGTTARRPSAAAVGDPSAGVGQSTGPGAEQSAQAVSTDVSVEGLDRAIVSDVLARTPSSAITSVRLDGDTLVITTLPGGNIGDVAVAEWDANIVAGAIAEVDQQARAYRVDVLDATARKVDELVGRLDATSTQYDGPAAAQTAASAAASLGFTIVDSETWSGASALTLTAPDPAKAASGWTAHLHELVGDAPFFLLRMVDKQGTTVAVSSLLRYGVGQDASEGVSWLGPGVTSDGTLGPIIAH